MRVHSVLLLLAATPLSIIDAAQQSNQFDSLGVDDVEGSVHPAQPQSHLGNEERFVAIPESIKTLLAATKSKLQNLADEKEGSKVLVSLGLNNRVDNLFDNPAWVTYMKHNGVKNKENDMLLALKKHYTDEELSSIFIAARRFGDEDVKKIALELQVQQLFMRSSHRKSPAAMFEHLGLNTVSQLENRKLTGKEEAVRLFDSQEFFLWQAYVLRIHNGNSKKATGAMAEVLTTFYGEERLVKMLLAAKGAEEKAVRNVAAGLQSEQLQLWAKDLKLPQDVFKLYELDNVPRWKMGKLVRNEANRLFDNIEYRLWEAYVHNMHSKTEKADEAMVDVLTFFFGEQKLSSILTAARMEKGKMPLVLRLRTAQLTRWKAGDKIPKEVASLMGFKGSAIDDPERELWRAYLQDYNVRHKLSPAPKTEP
uniref:Avirulence protein n=1 Tax=Peronospora matthiolae TaxID=2874970 RepID=A0AAV1TE64_9STRA